MDRRWVSVTGLWTCPWKPKLLTTHLSINGTRRRADPGARLTAQAGFPLGSRRDGAAARDPRFDGAKPFLGKPWPRARPPAAKPRPFRTPQSGYRAAANKRAGRQQVRASRGYSHRRSPAHKGSNPPGRFLAAIFPQWMLADRNHPRS